MKYELRTLIGRLNPVCKRALEEAAGHCVAQTNYNVEIEHFLIRLLDPPDTDLARVLRQYDVQPQEVSRQLTAAIDRLARGNSRTPALSPQVLSLIQEGWVYSSLQLGASRVRSAGIVLALLDQDAFRGQVLDSCPALLAVPREALHADIAELVAGSSEDAGDEPAGAAPLARTAAPRAGEKPGRSAAAATPSLDQFTLDLTARARAGEIDPIEGRDGEIRQIIDILMRRRQNNPILTGEAGVGKTAVVEGFALRIARGEVPPALAPVSLRVLDLALLQAGAGVKGEFENRLKSVIAEVKGSPTPVILFIDEAHNMIGAGGPAGQGDAANLLKPALARGELRTIAATTWSEYKKYFEKDPALARRFQVIQVDEPDEDKAIDMLRGAVAPLEKHHGVRVLDRAVVDAVRLSHRYISGRQLPDKAISVLDTACARVAVAQNGVPPAMEDVTRRADLTAIELKVLEREQATGAAHGERIAALSARIAELAAEHEKLATRFAEEKALVARLGEAEREAEGLAQSGGAERDKSLARLEELRRELDAIQGEEPMVPAAVDGRVVATVISGWTGIPVGQMLRSQLDTVLDLSARLGERVIGQEQAIDAIARRIRTSRAGLDDPGKPVGVFLLVGPSGVGKTETAVALADLLYGGERHMIVINMSEYQEAHTVSGLKGSPPGYVGFGTGGVLTEAVRRNPYSVVLLDEAEKAHSDVMELFYQVFDKGRLEDGEGTVVNFRNTVILLTCNVGAERILAAARKMGSAPPDADAIAALVRPDLVQVFKPALLGRLVVVPYLPLGDGEIRAIVKLKLDRIRDRFARSHRAALTYAPELVAAVAARCTEVDSGARNIDHILTHTLLPELSRQLLERMAKGEGWSGVHVALGDDGGFRYDIRE